MDKLDPNLLKQIEKVFSLKFHEWQINYILDIPMVLDMRITGRRTGKTFAYIIKLLFTDEEPIRAYDSYHIANLMDWYSYSDREPVGRRDTKYTGWFRNYLLDIYQRLTLTGIVPRKVIYEKPLMREDKLNYLSKEY